MGKEWHTIVDGKIGDVQCGETPVGEGPWFAHPNDWGGNPGDKLDWFDAGMCRIPDGELLAQGKRVNNKGRVYNIVDGTSRTIYDYDVELAEDETKETPPDDPCREFNRQTGHWFINEEKKALAKKEADIAQLKMQIENTERKLIRPLRAMQVGRATPKDIAKFNEYDTLIEQVLRPELNRLDPQEPEEEQQSA